MELPIEQFLFDTINQLAGWKKDQRLKCPIEVGEDGFRNGDGTRFVPVRLGILNMVELIGIVLRIIPQEDGHRSYIQGLTDAEGNLSPNTGSSMSN